MSGKKHLFYMRHFWVRGGEERAKKILTKLNLGGISDVFSSREERTKKTAKLFESVRPEEFQDAVWHEPILEAGSDDLFEKMYTKEVVSLLEEGLADHDAMEQIYEEEFRAWCFNATQGVRRAFGMMKGDSGLFVGHHPIIGLAALEALGGMFFSLANLQGVMFEADPEGNIRVDLYKKTF